MQSPLPPEPDADDSCKRVQARENQLIAKALEVLEHRLKSRAGRVPISSSTDASKYAWLKLAQREREVFAVMLLDNKGKLIEYRELFQGTLNRSAVFPREVARIALLRNAASVILVHNHPSGDNTPSEADISVTQSIKTALETVDIKMLDHLVVGDKVLSFMEGNLIDTTTTFPVSAASPSVHSE